MYLFSLLLEDDCNPWFRLLENPSPFYIPKGLNTYLLFQLCITNTLKLVFLGPSQTRKISKSSRAAVLQNRIWTNHVGIIRKPVRQISQPPGSMTELDALGWDPALCVFLTLPRSFWYVLKLDNHCFRFMKIHLKISEPQNTHFLASSLCQITCINCINSFSGPYCLYKKTQIHYKLALIQPTYIIF